MRAARRLGRAYPFGVLLLVTSFTERLGAVFIAAAKNSLGTRNPVVDAVINVAAKFWLILQGAPELVGDVFGNPIQPDLLLTEL